MWAKQRGTSSWHILESQSGNNEPLLLGAPKPMPDCPGQVEIYYYYHYHVIVIVIIIVLIIIIIKYQIKYGTSMSLFEWRVLRYYFLEALNEFN